VNPEQQAGIEELVSSQKVGANPCGCPPGQVQNLPLPQDIEKIQELYGPDGNCWAENFWQYISTSIETV
jgi:hypothetical protein